MAFLEYWQIPPIIECRNLHIRQYQALKAPHPLWLLLACRDSRTVLPRIGQVVQALDKLLMRVFDHLPVGTEPPKTYREESTGSTGSSHVLRGETDRVTALSLRFQLQGCSLPSQGTCVRNPTRRRVRSQKGVILIQP